MLYVKNVVIHKNVHVVNCHALTNDIQHILGPWDDDFLLSDNTLIYAGIKLTEWLKFKRSIIVSKMDAVTCKQWFPIFGPLNVGFFPCSKTLQVVGELCNRLGFSDGQNSNWI